MCTAHGNRLTFTTRGALASAGILVILAGTITAPASPAYAGTGGYQDLTTGDWTVPDGVEVARVTVVGGRGGNGFGPAGGSGGAGASVSASLTVTGQWLRTRLGGNGANGTGFSVGGGGGASGFGSGSGGAGVLGGGGGGGDSRVFAGPVGLGASVVLIAGGGGGGGSQSADTADPPGFKDGASGGDGGSAGQFDGSGSSGSFGQPGGGAPGGGATSNSGGARPCSVSGCGEAGTSPSGGDAGSGGTGGGGGGGAGLWGGAGANSGAFLTGGGGGGGGSSWADSSATAGNATTSFSAAFGPSAFVDYVVFDTNTLATASVGASFSADIDAYYGSSNDPATAYSISPALPNGLSLNTSTGEISGTPTATSSASYTVSASYMHLGGTYARTSKAFTLTVTASAPGVPTSVTATPGDSRAVVSFTAPVSDGGSTITSYLVTSTPSGITASGSTSPVTVTGLTNGITYTFTVQAINVAGTSLASNASTGVTPFSNSGGGGGDSSGSGFAHDASVPVVSPSTQTTSDTAPPENPGLNSTLQVACGVLRKASVPNESSTPRYMRHPARHPLSKSPIVRQGIGQSLELVARLQPNATVTSSVRGPKSCESGVRSSKDGVLGTWLSTSKGRLMLPTLIFTQRGTAVITMTSGPNKWYVRVRVR